MKPDYLKAYHRRGKALAALERYEEAITDFQFLLEQEPDNKEVNKELKDARMLFNQQQKQREEKEQAADPDIEELREEDLKDVEPEKPKKGFVSVAIDESSSDEEATISRIDSKFPLKTPAEIEAHAKMAKDLMKKGAEDFELRLKAADKAREEEKKEVKKRYYDEDFEQIDTSGKVKEVPKK